MSAAAKPSYEKPDIVRHHIGTMNKFGRQQAVRPLTHIDGAAVADLVKQYGSPLFVFSRRSLIQRYRDLRDAFTRRYPRVRLAWSYKTNYLEAICRTFHREGAWAEVVSPFEYDKALASGVPADQVHWNGPYKPDDAIARAIAGQSLLHVDNFDEIARIERIAERTGRRARLAVRVNMSLDGLVSWSRFGLNLESGQARQAITRILASTSLELVGLHTHIGTFILEPNAYRAATAKMVALANEIYANEHVSLSFIDMGGGFASPNTLRGQYLSGDHASPSFSQYAEAICDELGKLDYPAKDLPTLVLETGRALVDDAGFLIATVEATKRLPSGMRAVVVDAGVNILFTSFWYKHDAVPAQELRGIAEPTVIYGPLCMNIDVLHESAQLPALSAGERLVFRNVGAYNVTQWMQFITLRPAVVMIGPDGTSAIVRCAETLADLQSFEEVPEWVR